jgi:hypothetical protein
MSRTGRFATSARACSRTAMLAGMMALALAACDKGPDRAAVAAQLKADVEAQLKLVEGSMAPQMVSHSAVTVTPGDGDGYQVAIDGLKFQPSPEGYLEIGTVAYVATPKDEKSYEVSDLKLAPEFPFKSPDGKEKGKLTLTAKSFSGLWLRDPGVFAKAAAEFTGISAKDDQGGDLKVDSMKFTTDSADKGSGVFDLNSQVVLTGFQVKEDKGDGLFDIGETVIDAKYDSIKLADYQAAAKKYQEVMMKKLAAAEAAAATPDATPAAGPLFTPEEEKQVTEAVTAMAAAIKGGTFKMALNKLGYAEGGAKPFAADQISFGMAFDGINQEKASIGFDLAHQGLAIDTPEASSPLAKAVLPKHGNLGIKATEIPSKELTKLMADNLPGMMSADPAMAEANAMAMLVALQAVLQTSGAKIEVTPSALTADATEVKADGAFSVTPQSMLGATGTLNVLWTGLDEVMALAQANPADPSAQDVIGVVSMLMQFAKRETGADGKPVDTFQIDLKDTGEMLVNGQPM